MTYYIADFENTVPKPDWQRNGEFPEIFYELDDIRIDGYGEETVRKISVQIPEPENETYVWAAGIAEIHETDPEKVRVSNSIQGFFSLLYDIVRTGKDKQICIYFHNLAYDGPLIMDYLLRCSDMSPAKDKFRIRQGEYSYLISGDNKWYQITFKLPGTYKLIRIRDSLKLLPFSVASLQKNFKTKTGKIIMPKDFYSEQREPGHEITVEERKYLCHDILTVGECLAGVEKFGLLEHLTIGGAALADFKKRIGKEKYDLLFPELDEDQFVRKAYKGAWCYNATDGAVIDVSRETYVNISGITRKSETGYTYDVNSLYPSVLKGHTYPVGKGTWFEGKDFVSVKDRCYVVRFIASFRLKGHMPWIQLTNPKNGANTYLYFGEDIELTMTKPEFELFEEFYEITHIEIIGGYWYASVHGIFDGYVDHWFAVKAAEKHGNKCLYQIAKLYLNNLYGKLASAMIGTGAKLKIENDKLTRDIDVEARKGGHIASGAYVTAYARAVTIRSAEANWETFCYADTDSLHLLGKAKNITVGKELGQWNNESKWDKARFVRQKTYIEHIIEDEGTQVEPYWNVKACGASAAVKNRILHNCTIKNDNGIIVMGPDESNLCTDEELLEKFTWGLYEVGKLVHKTVKGGSILKETSFQISRPLKWKEVMETVNDCLTYRQ